MTAVAGSYASQARSTETRTLEKGKRELLSGFVDQRAKKSSEEGDGFGKKHPGVTREGKPT